MIAVRDGVEQLVVVCSTQIRERRWVASDEVTAFTSANERLLSLIVSGTGEGLVCMADWGDGVSASCTAGPIVR